MPVVLEKRGAGRKWPSAGRVAGDWAEMRVLQWFRGVCPHGFLYPGGDYEKSELSVVSFAGGEKKNNPVQPSPENPFGISVEGIDEYF